MLHVKLLGRFEMKHGSKTLSLTSRAAQSLFAFLILNAGTAYRREKLAGQLWPDSTEAAARDYLRHALWRIRTALRGASGTDYVQADDLNLSFDASSDYWLDAAAVREAEHAGTADQLADALASYSGELLPGFYDEWVVFEREHLQAIYERQVGRLLDLLHQAGHWSEIVQWAEKWIALGQKPEAAYRHLMSAYSAQGDMAKTAAAFERCVKALEGYGVEPSEQTLSLYAQLKAGGHSRPAQSRPIEEAQPGRSARNLPSPLTSFVGRDKEITTVARLLEQSRLVTLTGSGGVGKTRLAIQVAQKLVGRFKNGVCWIELAALADPALVLQAIAGGLDVRESHDESLIDALKRYLANKKMLLILDNCEHLITEAARTAESLVSSCPHLRILTTSRESLGVMGEAAYEVPTLSVPPPHLLKAKDLLLGSESVQLFVDRAKAARPDFKLTEDNAAAVHLICQRLDGIPLAIELAAARTKLLSVEHVASRLDDRFSLLTQGSRTALPRQRTLRATIDWSYDLLPDDARILFQRLAVFAGGFTLEAAEAICTGTPLFEHTLLDLLTRLVDRSLVQVEPQGKHQRYSMLESIREYARERLVASGEIEQLQQRHRDFFIRFAEETGPKLRSAEQAEWLDRLEEDQDNLRAAWDSAIRSDPQIALRLASALVDFWYRRGNPNEGREYLTQVLPFARQWGPTIQSAHALTAAGWLAHTQQDSKGARALLEEGLEVARLSGDLHEIAFALQWLGWTMTLSQPEHEAAQAMLDESLSMYENLADQWGIAMAISHLALLAQFDGRYTEAEERGRTSLAKFRQIGDKYWIGGNLNNLGELARAQGNYELAGIRYEQFREISQELGSPVAVAIASGNLAWVKLHNGDIQQAKALLKESLEYSMECGNKNGATTCLVGFAGMLGIMDKARQAAKLFGAVDALRATSGLGRRMEPVDKMEFDRYLAIVNGKLDNTDFATAWAAGRCMTLDEAVAFALEEAGN